MDPSVLHQDVPVSADQADNYVLLLVLLSVFAGGTLVLLSLLLLFCHRCCIGGRRYSRCGRPVARTNCLSSNPQGGCQSQRFCASIEILEGKNTFFSPCRASDDLEKTNTTYAEDSQPTQGQSCGGFKVYINMWLRCTVVTPDVPPLCLINQRSQFIWTNQMLSQLQAVMTESRSASSPPVRLVAESPSMNLHFMNRTGPLRTNLAGTVPLTFVY